MIHFTKKPAALVIIHIIIADRGKERIITIDQIGNILSQGFYICFQTELSSILRRSACCVQGNFI